MLFPLAWLVNMTVGQTLTSTPDEDAAEWRGETVGCWPPDRQ